MTLTWLLGLIQINLFQPIIIMSPLRHLIFNLIIQSKLTISLWSF